MESPSSKPKIVDNAVKLLYLSLVIGTINSIFFMKKIDSITIIGLVVIILIFCALPIYYISKGKYWMRTAYIFLYIISIPQWVRGLINNFNSKPFNYSVIILVSVINVVGYIMLYSKASNEWFRKSKK